MVSTHSRAKAAAQKKEKKIPHVDRFNTQPREGGCNHFQQHEDQKKCFNTQPREGGCHIKKHLKSTT